jgi:hypothetical protein
MTEAEITHQLNNAAFPTRDLAAAYWNTLIKANPSFTPDSWLFQNQDGSWTFHVNPGPGSQMLLEVK